MSTLFPCRRYILGLGGSRRGISGMGSGGPSRRRYRRFRRAGGPDHTGYPGGPELEIGYLLKRRFWHRGYAVRAAAACRDFAFTSLEAPRVVSIIRDTNEASKRVAERIGLRPRIHLCQAVLWDGYAPHRVCGSTAGIL